MTSTPTSYVQTWTRQGAERTVTPPVPEAVSPSSYALVFDPREDAIVYVRVTGYHQIGEAWRYRAGAWEGPLGQPIQASTEGLWQGHYDTARGAVVLWTIADGAPLGVTVSTEAARVLETSGDVPQLETEGFGAPEGTFGYDPGRERTVLFCRQGIWELDPQGTWTRVADSPAPGEWREDNDRHAVYDPRGERLVFAVVNDDLDLELHTWDGSQVGRLPEPVQGTYGSFPDRLFATVTHPEHGAVLLLGGEFGSYRLEGDAWVPVSLGAGLPTLAASYAAATPEGAVLVGPGTHNVPGAATPYRSGLFWELAPQSEAWRPLGQVKTKSPFDAGSGVLAISDGRGGAWVAHNSPGLQVLHVRPDATYTRLLSEEAGYAAWDAAGDAGRCPQALALDPEGRLHAFGSRGNVHRFDDGAWTVVAPVQTEAFKDRADFVVAWDPARAAFLAWGGEIKGRASNHTFVLEGDTWRQLKASSPKPADFAHGRKDDIYVDPFCVLDPLDGALLRFGYEDVSRLEGDVWVPHVVPGYRELGSPKRHAYVDPSTQEILLFDKRLGTVSRFDWAGCTALGDAAPHPDIALDPSRNTYHRQLMAEAVVADPTRRRLSAHLRDDGSTWFTLDLEPYLELAQELGPRSPGPERAAPTPAKASKPAKGKPAKGEPAKGAPAPSAATAVRLYVMDETGGKAWFGDVEGDEVVTRWGLLSKVARGEASETRKRCKDPTAELAKQAEKKRAKGYQDAEALSDGGIRLRLGEASFEVAFTAKESVYRLGGAPAAALPRDRWPQDPDGTPWTHVGTVPANGCKIAGVAVFVAPGDRAMEDEPVAIPLEGKAFVATPTAPPEQATLLPQRFLDYGAEVTRLDPALCDGLEAADPALAERLERWHAEQGSSERPSTLGGLPAWLQQDETPTDAKGARFSLAAQLDADRGILPLEHVMGTLYVFAHPTKKQAVALWQYT
ncbi:MAG: hypothetical protein R3F62_17755 [Planctomycetota bacterium]